MARWRPLSVTKLARESAKRPEKSMNQILPHTQIHLYSGVPAGIVYLTCVDLLDRHGSGRRGVS